MKMVNGLIAATVAMVWAFGSAQAAVVDSKNHEASAGAGIAVFTHDEQYSLAGCEKILGESLVAWADRFTESETILDGVQAAKINGWLPGNGRAVRVSMTCSANKNGTIKEVWRYTGVY